MTGEWRPRWITSIYLWRLERWPVLLPEWHLESFRRWAVGKLDKDLLKAGSSLKVCVWWMVLRAVMLEWWTMGWSRRSPISSRRSASNRSSAGGTRTSLNYVLDVITAVSALRTRGRFHSELERELADEWAELRERSMRRAIWWSIAFVERAFRDSKIWSMESGSIEWRWISFREAPPH